MAEEQHGKEGCEIKLVFHKSTRQNALTCHRATLYLNGQELHGVRRLVLDVDGAAALPLLKLELLPTNLNIDCPAELRELLRGRAKVRSVCDTE